MTDEIAKLQMRLEDATEEVQSMFDLVFKVNLTNLIDFLKNILS